MELSGNQEKTAFDVRIFRLFSFIAFFLVLLVLNLIFWKDTTKSTQLIFIKIVLGIGIIILYYLYLKTISGKFMEKVEKKRK